MSMGSKAGIKDSQPVNLSGAVAGGTTLITSSVIDLAQGPGFTSIAAMFLLGAVVDGAQVTLNAYASPNSDGSGSTLIGSSPTISLTNAANSNTVLAGQVIRSPARYVFFTITRATQNAALLAGIGLLTEARQYPPNYANLVGGTIHNFPGI